MLIICCIYWLYVIFAVMILKTECESWVNEKAVEKVLGLPKSTKIDIMISMGYPVKVTERGKRRKSVNEIRRFYKLNENRDIY